MYFTATAEGGYGASPDAVWTAKAQRGASTANTEPPANGLVEQSLSGGDLKGQLQDAKQGTDVNARRDLYYKGDGDRFVIFQIL